MSHGKTLQTRPSRAVPMVLVVEDTPICREPLVSALKLKGFEAAGAEDGQRALELIAKRRPDLVLLDIVMPRMDGWAFLKQVRADPAHANLPVILLTATADPVWVARARELGVSEYLLKGQFSMTELFARVQKCLRMPGTSDAPSRAAAHAGAHAAVAPAAQTMSAASVAVMAKVEGEVLSHAIELAASLKASVESLVALIKQHPQLAERVVAEADSTIAAKAKDPPDAKLDEMARGIARNALRSIGEMRR